MATPTPSFRRRARFLPGAMLAFAFAANADQPAPAAFFDAAPPSADSVLALPPELRALLQEKVIATTEPGSERLQALTRFIFDEDGLHMQYQSDATHTVAESFQSRRADCLGFTLLAVTLARASGLRATGQELDQVMARDVSADTLVQINHANTAIETDGRHFVIDVAADVVLAASAPHAVSDAHLLAMYYNNRAMDLMMQDKPDAADAWLQAALRADGNYANLWNNAGALAQRRGDAVAAERDFLHALNLSPKHSGALFNLIGLYRQIGRNAQANAWQQRAEKVLRNDPFHQYALGMDHEKAGNYADAQRDYQRAIKLDGNLHLFHFALARVCYLQGEMRRAGQELARASQLSSGTNHDAYQAKLDKLRRQMLH